jgi:hypothetical protein
MRISEILNEQMPGNKEIARMQQDVVDLQKMSASGEYDPNLTMNAMQRMATTMAKADLGSQMLKFFQTFATAIKEGIDSGVYGNRVGEMQTAYDQIIAQMPMLKQMAADSKAMAAKYKTPTGNLTKEDQTKRDFAPTKADATYAQGDAAVLRSKVDYEPAIEMKVIINQAMKNMIAQKIKFANNVSKSSGTDPKAVDKMLAKQPPLTAKNAKFKDKFSKTNETASGMGSSSIASVPNGVGAMQSRNMYNADGTMKNGVEYGNLLGGKTKKNKKKSKKPNA